MYEISDFLLERLRYRKIRPEIWAAAAAATSPGGNILEAGCGTGLNLPYQPQDREITAVDISERMLDRARSRARSLGRHVRFFRMDATALDFPAASFDVAVATFLFCVLPDEVQPAALSEIARVLKPGGRLILLEYTLSRNPFRRFWMRVLAPYVRWMYRAGFDRRTAEHLKAGGWRIAEDRFVWKDAIRLLVAEPPPG